MITGKNVGNDSTTNLGNSHLSAVINNLTQSENSNNLLESLQNAGGGGGGKTKKSMKY